ncbi:MAG: glycosyltransferase [Lachnospiraceae bacterium]|nr:glycosyltransferase [Lachnospiraceae bacterium]
MQPLVSVIMPAYNGEKYIGEAIESILNQTHENLELIIVEDHSTDRTPEVIRRYQDPRLRVYFNGRNEGISYSTNRGIDESRGKYIALLDDDDIATRRRLEWQTAFLEEHGEIDVLGARSALIDRDGKFLRYDAEPIYNPKYIKANLLFYNKKFANCTVMIRKAFMEKNHLRYQDHCLGMQDFKFYIDSSKVGTISSIDRLVHLKRIHEEEATVLSKKFHGKERADLFAQFQRESIYKSGFCIGEEHLQAINDVVTEIPKDRYSIEDVKRLYLAFREIVLQARQMEIDYLSELEYACKRILGERVLPRADLFGRDITCFGQVDL